MDPVQVLTALAGLSALAKNVRDLLTQTKTAAAQAANEAKADSASIKAIANISPEMLKPLDERIARARRKIQDRLEDPHTTIESIQRILEESEKEICAAIEMIKKFNGGTLPTPRYEKISLEHACGKK